MFRLLLTVPFLALVLMATGCATHKEEKKCSGDSCCADSAHKAPATHGKKKSH